MNLSAKAESQNGEIVTVPGTQLTATVYITQHTKVSLNMSEDNIEYAVGDEPLQVSFDLVFEPPLTESNVQLSIESFGELPDGLVTIL